MHSFFYSSPKQIENSKLRTGSFWTLFLLFGLSSLSKGQAFEQPSSPLDLENQRPAVSTSYPLSSPLQEGGIEPPESWSQWLDRNYPHWKFYATSAGVTLGATLLGGTLFYIYRSQSPKP
jgi:hypothetical protein